VFENQKHLTKKLKQLRIEQRKLQRCKKGSKNREKQRIKVANIHEKITNQRLDYIHQITSQLIKSESQAFALEDLNIGGMMKNHKLAQSLSDVSLGTFYTMLEYKSKWNDKSFVKIDRFFPSSKTCSNCGWIYQDLNLSIREWTCPSCNEHHDRDLNASKNILKQGINILSGYGIESDIKQKQEEALSLDKSVIPETQPSLVVG
jgi:putative transposase